MVVAKTKLNCPSCGRTMLEQSRKNVGAHEELLFRCMGCGEQVTSKRRALPQRKQGGPACPQCQKTMVEIKSGKPPRKTAKPALTKVRYQCTACANIVTKMVRR